MKDFERLQNLSKANTLLNEAWAMLGPARGAIDDKKHTDLMGVIMRTDELIVGEVEMLVRKGAFDE